MSKRNPRKNANPDDFCEHIYPDGDLHGRDGKQCGAIKRKGSRFCTYHQPKGTPQHEELLEQLGKAREKAVEKIEKEGHHREKHGFYSKTRKECDKCAISDACNYFEPGKKACDFNLNPEVDLSSLSKIEAFVEDIVSTEMKRYKKLEPFFDADYENMELFDMSSRIGKRLTSIIKDYASIKDMYEKRRSPSSLIEALTSKKT
jgi:hypothetical protein